MSKASKKRFIVKQKHWGVKKMRVIKNKLFVILSIFLLVFAVMPNARAASLTSLSDTMSRLKASTASNHTIGFTTSTGVDASSDTITLDFASFSGTVTASDVALTHGPTTGQETSETISSSASSGVWGAGWSATTLTLTAPTNASSGEITANDKVLITISNNKITNSVAGTYTITIGGTFGDSGKVAVAIIANDQVVMSASVDPSITFSLSGNTSAFGALSTSSVTTAGTDITMTVATNGQTGYNIAVRDTGSGSNPGLYNATAGALIGSVNGSYGDGPVTLSAGTEGYGVYVSSTTGSPAVASRYNGGSGGQVGGLETTSTTIISRASGMSANDTATVSHKAAISGWTKAGSYSDTITYVATGNF